MGILSRNNRSVAPFFDEGVLASQINTGKYYFPDVNFTAIVTVTTSADKIFYTPFITRYTHTYQGIAVYNSGTGDSGDKFRLGIYSDTGAGYPGTRLLDAGEVTLDATRSLHNIAISQSLTANTPYWLAFINEGASFYSFTDTTGTGTGGVNGYPLSNYGISSFQIDNNRILTESQLYGTLPATATPDGAAKTSPVICMKG